MGSRVLLIMHCKPSLSITCRDLESSVDFELKRIQEYSKHQSKIVGRDPLTSGSVCGGNITGFEDDHHYIC